MLVAVVMSRRSLMLFTGGRCVGVLTAIRTDCVAISKCILDETSQLSNVCGQNWHMYCEYSSRGCFSLR